MQDRMPLAIALALERWTVDRCGEAITYTVTYTSAPQEGERTGTAISVHLDQPEDES